MHSTRAVPNVLFAVVFSSILALAAGACASSGGSGSSGRSSSVLTRAQIDETGASTAMEAVQQLRSRWLRRRGPSSVQDPTPAGPLVYMDGRRFGELESLDRVDVRSIEEIRFISAIDATTRYGTGHSGGVILITTVP